MKYICTTSKHGEEIFTFPHTINHDAMAEALEGIKNQTHGNWDLIYREPISAGFVDFKNNCFGESETLGIKSRGAEDTLLLLKHD